MTNMKILIQTLYNEAEQASTKELITPVVKWTPRISITNNNQTK